MNDEHGGNASAVHDDQTGANPMSRRELVALLGSGVLATALPSCAPRPSSGTDALADPLYYSSVKALASAIQRKVLSSEEVV